MVLEKKIFWWFFSIISFSQMGIFDKNRKCSNSCSFLIIAVGFKLFQTSLELKRKGPFSKIQKRVIFDQNWVTRKKIQCQFSLIFEKFSSQFRSKMGQLRENLKVICVENFDFRLDLKFLSYWHSLENLKLDFLSYLILWYINLIFW